MVDKRPECFVHSNACCGDGNDLLLFLWKIETPNDVKYLSEFQEINFESNENWLTSDNLSLYVDYSTCMAQALKTSPFFQI